MGREGSAQGGAAAPATAAEAALQFRESTGMDLSTEPRFAVIHHLLTAWRAVLAISEYEPLVSAIAQADESIRARSVRAIPRQESIQVEVEASPRFAVVHQLVDRTKAGFEKIDEGFRELESCVVQARSTGLIPKTGIGRPEDALPRAVAALLVELVERDGGPERLTATQAALVAQAYGVAAPAGAWRDWVERWRRLMKEARSAEPRADSAIMPLLQVVRSARPKESKG